MTDIMDLYPSKIVPEPNSGCWLFDAPTDTGGYVQIASGVSKRLAHRVSYELKHGAIAEKMDLDHLCRVRCCVNPDHLEAVTERENTLRSPIAFAARNHRKTHCSRGHELSGWNLIVIQPTGKPGGMHTRRACRICVYANIERYRAKKKAASKKHVAQDSDEALIRVGCGAP